MMAMAKVVKVAVTVRSGQETASGTIRLRGQSTRWLSKRSFRIKLSSGTIDGRRRLKLLAEVTDETRLQNLLSFGLFERMGALAPRARPVLLRINGAVYGVYNDIEHVGDDFFAARGYAAGGDRFRNYGPADNRFGLRYTDSGAVDVADFDKKENTLEPSPELESLIVALNTTAEHEIDAALDNAIDMPVFVDYVAGQILMSNFEVTDGNHYIALDPSSARFLLVPWDLNNGTWSQTDLSVANNTLFTAGNGWWGQSWLWTRAFGSRSFRESLAGRLESLLQTVFATPMDDAVDTTYASIAPALDVDPWVWKRRYEGWLAAGPEKIHAFVAQRRAFVEAAIAALPELGDTGIIVSSIEPGSASIELENRSADTIDLGSCWLTRDPQAPLTTSLAGLGTLAPQAQSTLSPADVRSTGGLIAVYCEQGEAVDDDAPMRLNAFAFYPPMTDAQAYVLGANGWSLQGGN